MDLIVDGGNPRWPSVTINDTSRSDAITHVKFTVVDVWDTEPRG